MTKQELAQHFGVSINTLDSNFPKFCQNKLKKGIKITREGYGEKANYTITQVEPQEVDKSIFSIRGITYEEIPDEQWTDVYCSKNYEVSDHGRIRHKKTKQLLKGTLTSKGYSQVMIDCTSRLLHRVVLQSWQPIDNYEYFTVDHINGIRSDNRLLNLRWSSLEDNIYYMTEHRGELNTELSRLIQKYGYDETLVKLQNL